MAEALQALTHSSDEAAVGEPLIFIKFFSLTVRRSILYRGRLEFPLSARTEKRSGALAVLKQEGAERQNEVTAASPGVTQRDTAFRRRDTCQSRSHASAVHSAIARAGLIDHVVVRQLFGVCCKRF